MERQEVISLFFFLAPLTELVGLLHSV